MQRAISIQTNHQTAMGILDVVAFVNAFAIVASMRWRMAVVVPVRAFFSIYFKIDLHVFILPLYSSLEYL